MTVISDDFLLPNRPFTFVVFLQTFDVAERDHAPVLSTDSLNIETMANTDPQTQTLYFNVYVFDPDPIRQMFRVQLSVLGLGASVSLNQTVLATAQIYFTQGDGTSDDYMDFQVSVLDFFMLSLLHFNGL